MGLNKYIAEELRLQYELDKVKFDREMKNWKASDDLWGDLDNAMFKLADFKSTSPCGEIPLNESKEIDIKDNQISYASDSIVIPMWGIVGESISKCSPIFKDSKGVIIKATDRVMGFAAEDLDVGDVTTFYDNGLIRKSNPEEYYPHNSEPLAKIHLGVVDSCRTASFSDIVKKSVVVEDELTAQESFDWGRQAFLSHLRDFEMGKRADLTCHDLKDDKKFNELAWRGWELEELAYNLRRLQDVVRDNILNSEKVYRGYLVIDSDMQKLREVADQ